jgi:hypothetical protein
LGSGYQDTSWNPFIQGLKNYFDEALFELKLQLGSTEMDKYEGKATTCSAADNSTLAINGEIRFVFWDPILGSGAQFCGSAV